MVVVKQWFSYREKIVEGTNRSYPPNQKIEKSFPEIKKKVGFDYQTCIGEGLADDGRALGWINAEQADCDEIIVNGLKDFSAEKLAIGVAGTTLEALTGQPVTQSGRDLKVTVNGHARTH